MLTLALSGIIERLIKVANRDSAVNTMIGQQIGCEKDIIAITCIAANLHFMVCGFRFKVIIRFVMESRIGGNSSNDCSRLDTAMKTEKETMRLTLDTILAKVPAMKGGIERVKETTESLAAKEEALDDEINDTCDQLVAMIEERRTILLDQLHFRVSTKREKLGNMHRILSYLIITLRPQILRGRTWRTAWPTSTRPASSWTGP
jgi:hypothetical protein